MPVSPRNGSLMELLLRRRDIPESMLVMTVFFCTRTLYDLQSLVEARLALVSVTSVSPL